MNKWLTMGTTPPTARAEFNACLTRYQSKPKVKESDLEFVLRISLLNLPIFTLDEIADALSITREKAKRRMLEVNAKAAQRVILAKDQRSENKWHYTLAENWRDILIIERTI